MEDMEDEMRVKSFEDQLAEKIEFIGRVRRIA